MCFSAQVSYGSAAFLIATGTMTTFGNNTKEYRMIAAIPLLFGVQQMAEGLVWQTLGHDSASVLAQFGSLLFVSIALVVWPSWLPWSLYHVEVQENRKQILKVISYMGLAVSLLAATILLQVEVKAAVVGHSLVYTFLNFERSWPASLDFLLYDIPTMVPFFVSSSRTVKKAGYLVLIGLLTSQVINKEATTSIWCFFAALVSLYIAVSILWQNRGEAKFLKNRL